MAARETGAQINTRLVLVSLCAVAAAASLRAATFQVTSVNDTGAGSLRQAVANAINAGGANTITFDPALARAQIVLQNADDNSLMPSALRISSDITIDGVAAPNLVLSGASDPSRNLRLFIVTPTGHLTLKRITLSNGQARGGDGTGSSLSPHGAGGGGCGMGGAIFNQGNLEVNSCTLTSNAALGGDGGPGEGGTGAGGGPNGGIPGQTNPYGIGGAGGPGGFGGGGGGGGASNIAAGGNGGQGGFGGGGGGGGVGATASGLGGQAGFAGGIGSVVNGGGGAGLGGAIFNEGGTVLIKNSTFYGNLTVAGSGYVGGHALGGAVFSRNGTVIVLNSTLAGNTAETGTELYEVADNGAGQAVLQNAILFSGPGSLPSAVINQIDGGTGQLTASEPNILSNYAAFNGATANSSGALATDPQILPLDYNGGPTQTMALTAGSPAIDAANSAIAPVVDQRGRLRSGPADIGAYEFIPPGAPPAVTSFTKTGNEDTPISFTPGDFSANFSAALPSDTLYVVAITSLPSHGVLELYGQPLAAGAKILYGDLGALVFQPALHWYGSASFTWNAADTAGPTYAPAGASVTLTLTHVNVAPVAGAGTALVFDGQQGYLALPSFDFGPPFTVEAWVNTPNPYSGGAPIFDFGDGPGLNNITLKFSAGTGQMTLQLYDDTALAGSVTTTAVFPANTWVHVAAAVDEFGNAAIYWNGIAQATGTVLSVANLSRAYHLVGRSTWATDALFAGQLDELRVWDLARQPSDIQSTLDVPLADTQPDLIGYWRFDEGVELTAYDSTPAGNDAALMNMDPATAWVPSDAWKYHTTPIDTPVTVGAGYDIDSPVLTLSLPVPPQYGMVVFDQENLLLTYTPPPGLSGRDQFTFQLSDGQLASSYAMVMSFGPNHPPHMGSLLLPAVPVNTTLNFTADEFIGAFYDVDLGDSLSEIVITSLPEHGVLELNSTPVDVGDPLIVSDLDGLAFVPDTGWYGTTFLEYNGADTFGPVFADAPAWARIVVAALPVLSDVNMPAVDEGVDVTFTAADFTGAFSDADAADGLSAVQILSLPPNGTLHLADGGAVHVNDTITAAELNQLVFTPDPYWSGGTSFGWNAADTIGGLYAAESAQVNITVDFVNHPPTVSDFSKTANENQKVTFTGADFPFSDPDPGDALSAVEITSLPANGTLALNGVTVTANAPLAAAQLSELVFTPAANWSGTTSFGWNGADSYGEYAAVTATANITINLVNYPPVLIAIDKPPVNVNQPVVFAELDFTTAFFDSDGDALAEVQITSLPANGTLALNGVTVTANAPFAAVRLNELVFTPASNWSGKTSFGWNGADGTGTYAASPALVNINVQAVLPYVLGFSASTASDQVLLFQAEYFISNFFINVANDTLGEVKIVSLPANAALTLNGVAVTAGQEIPAAGLNGLALTPSLSFGGITSFDWNGADSLNSFYAAVTATVQVTVTFVNLPPVISSVAPVPPATEIAGKAVDFSVAATDPDGDTPSYDWNFGDGSAHGTTALITHIYASTGVYTATVTVSDGHGGSATSSVTVIVNAKALPGDADGDGYSDEIELALGSDPYNYSSTPAGLPPATPAEGLNVLKLAVKLNFAKPSNNDSIKLSGAVPLPANFDANGQKFILDVGGVVYLLPLGANGASPKGIDVVKLTHKPSMSSAQAWKFSISLTKGSFYAYLQNAGLQNANVPPRQVTIPVTIVVDALDYDTNVTLTYTAKQNKQGVAKK